MELDWILQNLQMKEFIQKWKEMPAGVVNPASLCNPPIQSGDIMIAINGKQTSTFADTIKIIRGLENGVSITLELERGNWK